MKEIYVYIASPFFNEEQLNLVRAIEFELAANAIKFYSPRFFGITSDNNDVDLQSIYESNIDYMARCNLMIAVVGESSTMWELGYFSNSKMNIKIPIKNIITISKEGYLLNDMARFATDCHVNNVDTISNIFHLAKERNDLSYSLNLHDIKLKR